MMPAIGRLLGFCILTLLAIAWPCSARAQDAALLSCITSNESSIEKRSEHKLLEARARALECAADTCPAQIRDACKKRVDQVNALLPTVVFDVKDASGADVAIQITMDGKPLERGVDGTAIPADPGEHKFVFTTAGQAPIEKTFILREGEKNRHEPIVVGGSHGQTASPSPGPSPGVLETTPARWSRQKTLAVAAGGLGVAGLALGSVFAVMAKSSWSHSQSECSSASDCSQHEQAVLDHDSATRSATVATIAMAAGAAAIAGAAVLWFTAPREGATPGTTTSFFGVSPAIGPEHAGIVLRGGF